MQVEKRKPLEGQIEKKMYVGLETFKIIAVNPNISEINKLYGKEDSEDDKDIDYVDESKTGEDRVRITLFLRAQVTNRICRINFFITDKERTNKDGTKYQYINQVCQTSWADDEKNLVDFFLEFTDKNKTVTGKKAYRIAKEGEGDFYEFIRGVMKGIDYNSPKSIVGFDFKKLLKGNFKEINQWLLDEEYTMPFTALNYIKDVDGDEGVKNYNEVFTKVILPADFLGKVTLACTPFYKETLKQIQENEEEFERLKIGGIIEALTVNDIYGYVNAPVIRFKNEYDEKAWVKFRKEIDGEYGCKGFYKLSPVFEYSPTMNITSGSAILAGDSSY